jgi:membrane-associated protease RseP (regulator of RpoE activity)
MKSNAQIAKKKLTFNEKLGIAAIVIIFGFIFIEVATSTMTNWIKAPLLISAMFISSYCLKKVGRFENYYGIIILRGEKGFGLMHFFAKYPKTMRALADFGLSLGFGMIYSYWIYKKHLKKFLIHFILVAGFFSILLLGSNATVFSNDYKNFILPAIGVFGGLLFFGIAAMAIQAFNILTVPGTTAGATFVVPGVTIPFWEGMIAIVLAATVHEIAHGVLAMVEKLEVKNSGAILFGIIPIGAFVEPNEERLSKIDIHKRRRILIAGTTANFLMFLLFVILSIPLAGAVIGFADGVRVVSIAKESASFGILADNEIIHSVNGIKMANYREFAAFMKDKKEGEKLAIGTNLGVRTITLGKNGKLGITPEDNYPKGNLYIDSLMFIAFTFQWILLINFALAVINLVPIFLTDGYRLVFEEARGIFPSKNDRFAKRIAIVAGALAVVLLLINILPNFK